MKLKFSQNIVDKNIFKAKVKQAKLLFGRMFFFVILNIVRTAGRQDPYAVVVTRFCIIRRM